MALNLKNFTLILLVFLIALFFRFWKLASFPVSLSVDEVAIGYNAFSVLHTGRDEWGEKLPLVFKSVGDYKPPVNIYLTVPSVALFGLTEFAVRFPVALIGSLSAVAFIFLLRALGISWAFSLIGGAWLAISPWHVNFSRSSFEAVTALFFLILGTLFFVMWNNGHKNFLFPTLSAVSFSLSIWSYHAERMFAPLLIIFLFLLFRKSLFNKDNRKSLKAFLIIGAIFAIPFIRLTFFTPAISTRAASTSIFREDSLARALHNGNYANLQEFVFNNDAYLVFRHWAGKYLNYYDFRFWFFKGMQFTPPGYPDLGLLFLADLPIVILGFYSLVISKNSVLKKTAVFWFLAGPLPASFTMNEQHPLRALVWLPFFGIAFICGAEFIWTRLRKQKIFLVVIYIVLLSFNILYFKDIYFVQSPRFFSEFSQYGFKEIAIYACEHQSEYKNVAISEVFGSDGPLITGIPYAYVLFYCKYDPQKYLASRLGGSKDVDNIVFRRVEWKSDSTGKNMLLVASPWDLPPDQIPSDKILKKIYFLNGKLGFLFVKI